MQQATNLRIPPPPKPSDAPTTSTSTAGPSAAGPSAAGPSTAGPSTAGPSTTAANTIDLTAEVDTPHRQEPPLIDARRRDAERAVGDRRQDPRDLSHMLFGRGMLKLFSTLSITVPHGQYSLRHYQQLMQPRNMKSLRGSTGSISSMIWSSGKAVYTDGRKA